MTNSLVVDLARYAHLISLALWFGGLFGYVLIVWPAIVSHATSEFPRALLAQIAMRTGPWIYLAMISAVVSFGLLVLLDPTLPGGIWLVIYGVGLLGVVANNVYGTLVAWPRMMLLPATPALVEWRWFRIRMGLSLVVGLTLFSVAVLAT